MPADDYKCAASSTTRNRTPKLVVLSAPSGAGKSTLVSMLVEKYPNDFQLSISCTTRAARGEEKNGVHYFFISEKEFKEKIAQGHFLEHALVFGKYWYGTSKEFVEDVLSKNKNVVFDIDVQGAASLKKLYGPKCVTIFLQPPSLEELEKRLKNRKTDSEQAIEQRLKTAKEELKQAQNFDHQIVNQDLKITFSELVKTLKEANCL